MPSFSLTRPYRVSQHGAQMWGQCKHSQGVEGGPIQQWVPEILGGQQHDEVHYELSVQHQEPGHGCTHHTTAVLNEPQCPVPCRVACMGTSNHHSACQAPRFNICTCRQQWVVLLHISQSVVWRLHPALEEDGEAGVNVLTLSLYVIILYLIIRQLHAHERYWWIREVIYICIWHFLTHEWDILLEPT